MAKGTAYAAGTRLTSGRTARDYTIVVAYDGELTEDDYFRGWKLVIPASRLSLEGLYVKSGGNVLEAVNAAAKKKRKLKGYAEFWCVCDVDDTSEQDLIRAKHVAAEQDIRLCLSSRCFEVWLMLHYEFSDASISSEKDAIDRIGKHFSDYGKPYKMIAFHELHGATQTAIDNAVRLAEMGLANPMTQVHHLVRKLKQNC